MGMIQTFMKRVPEGKTAAQYAGEVHERAQQQIYEERGDGCECEILTLAKFEEIWEDQENLKKTDEIKEKYRKLTEEGQVIYLEMDW